LARVTVKAREVARAERPPANLVFLVDVSGSMEPENRLPLVQRTLRLLVDRLNAGDRVGIVTYAGNAAVALPPCSGADKASILAAIDRLRAGGSTHGSDGIRTAYAMARANRSGDAVNRVILCTDGDFNVGQTSDEDLLALVRGEAKSGVFLTVLGYGMDNYRDRTMQLLADNGNGTHAYIDSFREAQKVMATELESTLVTVAKDAKLQIEFNPERVSQWRLIGYEKRVLADRDFNDDTKDAGDLGAGHAVTALYELVPASVGSPGVDPLRYGATPAANPTGPSRHPDELMDVKLRYKEPDSETSRLVRFAVKDGVRDGSRAGVEMRFASAVAGFGMLLRNSPDKGQLTYDLVLQLAEQGIGEDRDGYRGEFIDLVRRAKSLSGK
jgi:Ca-activated chloride channel family protein